MDSALTSFICCAVIVVGFTSSSGNAHSPDISSGAYIGCFDDIGQHATFIRQFNATKREPVSCRERCRNEGYTYIGLRGGWNCWCANNLYERSTPYRTSSSGMLEKVNDSHCNASCADNSTLSCGGSSDEYGNSTFSVYSVCQKTKYGKKQCKLSCNCKDDNHCSVYGVCPGNECAPGWKSNVINNRRTCNSDIDECQMECNSNHTSDCHNCNSRSNERCSNTNGGYTCICKTGFHNASEGCKDVDECEIDNGGCQHHCNNTPGSFDCFCQPGFRNFGDSMNEKTIYNCTDIDECSERSSKCDHSCNNTIGNYTCGCLLGFQLQDNGFSCKVVKADLESAFWLRIGLISSCSVIVILLGIILFCNTRRRLKIAANKKSEKISSSCIVAQPFYESAEKEERIVSSNGIYEEVILDDFSFQTAQPNYESLHRDQIIVESNQIYEELRLNI